ncbi:MAG: hypothetical protein QM737_05060 [Ferruginibacter sp.]
MKKIISVKSMYLAVLFVSAIIFDGCKKDHDNGSSDAAGNYYVRFKVDGMNIEYNQGTEGKINTVDGNGRYICQVIGLKQQFVADKGTMGFVMTSTNPVNTSNTYVNYGSSSANIEKAILLQAARFDDNGTFFASWGDDYATFGILSDTKVNFTEINSTYIKGTFSATIYKEIDGNSEKHTITDGEFRVKIVR